MKHVRSCLAVFFLLATFFNVSYCSRAEPADTNSVAASFTVEAKTDNTGRFAALPALQSFAWAQWQGKWIIVAGRTTGYHGVGAADADFPRARSNRNIWVIDTTVSPAKVFSRSLDELPQSMGTVKDQLAATNPLHYQDGDSLLVAGGYGENSAGQWVTYNLLSIIRLPDLVEAVTKEKPDFWKAIRYTESELVRSTGGELLRAGENSFFLAGGHVFMGRYTAFESSGEKNTQQVSQVYLAEIRQLDIRWRETPAISIKLKNKFQDPEFARRDLNGGPFVYPDGKKIGAALYGGVFTKEQLNFSHPIYLSADGAPRVDTETEQKLSAYTCARFFGFDERTKDFYATFLGGISRWTWSAKKQEIQKAPLVGTKASPVYYDGMPWVDQISSLVTGERGTREVVQSGNRLPAYMGANAGFFLDENVPRWKGQDEVVDIDKIRGKSALVGYLYGGIQAWPRAFPFQEDSPLYNSGNVYTKPSSSVVAIYVTFPDK